MGKFGHYEKKAILFTGLAHSFHHIGMLLFPPVLVAVKKDLNVSIFILSVIYTISGFCNGLGALPSGILIDRLGTKRPLILNLVGVSIGAILIFLSRDIYSLAVGLAILGLFSSLYHPAGLTLISHTVKERTHALGFHGIAGSLGLAFGPLFSGFVASFFSWRTVFLIFGLAGFALTFMVQMFLKEYEIHEGKNRIVQTNATLRSTLIFFFMISILYGMAYAGFTTFIPIHFSENAKKILSNTGYIIRGGVLTSIVLLAGVLGQYLGGIIGSRKKLEVTLFFIILLNIPLLILMTLSKNWMLLIITILFGIVHFAYQPVQNSLLAEYTSHKRRGTWYGVQSFLAFGVGSSASAISGYITDLLSVRWVFITMGLILIPALISVIILYFMDRNRVNENR
ncbi:MAG: MFS transporter [Candidatus Marinimicrobia bacterium]|nr:MFS transporter [Candidatus Neomarinimicrobiota bacterium]